MEPNLRAFRDKFLLDQYTICETNHWIWSVRPVQATLGAGILSLRRYCERLSDITAEEGADLAKMAHIIEPTLRRHFAYDKINYLMLMMVDPHLHYHVLPRYAAERSFGGLVFTDPGWPAHPSLQGPTPPPNVLEDLRKLLAGD